MKKIASRDASSSPAAAVQDGLEGTWRKELLKALLQGARNFENSLASLEPQRDVASIVNGMLKFSDDEAVQKEESDEYQKIRSQDGEAWAQMQRKYRALASAGVLDVVRRAISARPRRLRVLGAEFSGCWRAMTRTTARSARR